MPVNATLPNVFRGRTTALGALVAAVAAPLVCAPFAHGAPAPAGIDTGYSPGEIAISPADGTLAVAENMMFDHGNSIHRYGTPALTETPSIAGGASIVEFSTDGSALYAADNTTLRMIDNATGTVTRTVDLGEGRNIRPEMVTGIALDDAHHRAYVSVRYTGSTFGDVVVVDTSAGTVVGVLGRSGDHGGGIDSNNGVAVSADGSVVYVARWGGVDAIDTGTGAIRGIPAGPANNSVFTDIKLSRDGRTAYTTDRAYTYAIDTATGASTIAKDGLVPIMASALALSPDGTKLYATVGMSPFAPGNAWLYTIDPATMTVASKTTIPHTLPTGTIGSYYGADLALSPSGSCAYVAGGWGQTLDGGTNRTFSVNRIDAIPVGGAGSCGEGTGTGNPDAFRPGQSLTVTFTGLLLEHLYRTQGESTPFCVNDVARSDAHGTLQFTCEIPAGLESGTHHFTVYDGANMVASIEFQVAPDGGRQDTGLSGQPTTTGPGPGNPSENTGAGSLANLFGS